MTDYGIILFHTTSAAMRAEKVLSREGFPIKLIPVPRELSSDCGVSLRFDWNQQEQVRLVLDKAKVEIAGIHPYSEE